MKMFRKKLQVCNDQENVRSENDFKLFSKVMPIFSNKLQYKFKDQTAKLINVWTNINKRMPVYYLVVNCRFKMVNEGGYRRSHDGVNSMCYEQLSLTLLDQYTLVYVRVNKTQVLQVHQETMSV